MLLERYDHPKEAVYLLSSNYKRLQTRIDTITKKSLLFRPLNLGNRLFKLNICRCPQTSSNTSPSAFQRNESSSGILTVEVNCTLLLANTLNGNNEAAPDCVTVMRRQQRTESGVHRGPPVDLISLCLPPRAMPENLQHNHKHVCAPSTDANRCKRDKLRVSRVYQCVGMAAQLGGKLQTEKQLLKDKNAPCRCFVGVREGRDVASQKEKRLV